MGSRMMGSFFRRLTIIGPIVAVVAAALWIGYTVLQSRLATLELSEGLLIEIAAADRAGEDDRLDQLFERGWASVELDSEKIAVNEPIMLALLEVQVEMRRILGPSFRTNVAAVRDDPACQIDLIEQQLIWIYAASIATTQGPRSRGTVASLTRFARELACISGLQAAVLDTALTSSFNTVALRLQQRELDSLVPYLARFVAPLQLMILDLRKNVGVQSAAWRWFNRWNTVLVKQIAYGGWVTDRVYVWDRRNGVVTGFAPCSAGENQRYCVDIKVLLNSISEGKHLGLGNCSFAGMISNLSTFTDTGQRYVCGVNFCSDRKRYKPKFPIAETTLARLESMWPNLIEEDDRKQFRELCFSTAVDKQSAFFDPRSCQNALYGSRASNPFNQHLACLTPVAAAEKAKATWQLTTDGDLLGVPQNPSCEILNSDTTLPLPPVSGCESGAACLDYRTQLVRVPEAALEDSSGLLRDEELGNLLLNPLDQGTAALCDNPAGCTTQCTALSQQITRENSCSLMLDPDEPQDRPIFMPIEQLADPLYLRIWNESAHVPLDEEPEPEDAFRSCSLGGMNEARPAVRCGLLMCPDGAPAVGVNGACSCRGEFGGNFTNELMCARLGCADGQTADESCNCFRPDVPVIRPRSALSAPARGLVE
jgi:hypothetical protein